MILLRTDGSCAKKSLIIHTCDISLFRRDLCIFCPFLRKSPYLEFDKFPTYLIHLPILNFRSPFQTSRILFLLIWKRKSPYLSSQMYHMSDYLFSHTFAEKIKKSMNLLNGSLVYSGTGKSQPWGPPFQWETQQSLVSHWNDEPSGWDFPVPTGHQ